MAGYFDCVHADAEFLKGNYKEAFGLYFKGANEFGSSRAAFDLAYMYHRGIHVPKNYDMAHDYYIYASMLEGGAPYFNIAVMCLRGQGRNVDFKKAVEYMKRADAMGCVDAQIYLGTAYTVGYVFDPIEIECISMIPFYRVIKRDVSELFLGQALIEGVGREYSPEKGYRMIERAALEDGSHEAAAYLVAHNDEAKSFGIDSRRVAGMIVNKKG